MAYDIEDRKIVEFCASDRGIEILSKFLEKTVGEIPMLERHSDGTILFTFYVAQYGLPGQVRTRKVGKNEPKTNTIGINAGKRKIDSRMYINPISNNIGENVTTELRDFILDIVSFDRDKKITELLNINL